MMGFIVAFNGNRDSYQVPWALAEQGLLDTLVTDYYRGTLPVDPRALRHRASPGIHPRLVSPVPMATAVQYGWRLAARLDSGLPYPTAPIDNLLAKRADRIAATMPGSDLLLYSGCALPVFRRRPERRRVLFQFHPHPDLIREVLLDDARHFPSVDFRPEPELARWSVRSHRDTAEVQMADEILCASSFTARSVRKVKPSAKIHVVPYGTEVSDRALQSAHSQRRPGRPRLLFVGQGVQRKGLHHLLLAWPHLRRHCELTLILTSPDPAIASMVPTDVQVRERVPRDELDAAMSDADVFVLPSLVEGFGLVLTEALSHGCHLVSTTNTGLPDLELPDWAATVYEELTVEALVTALQTALRAVDERPCPPGDYRQLALQHNWEFFRKEIVAAVS